MTGTSSSAREALGAKKAARAPRAESRRSFLTRAGAIAGAIAATGVGSVSPATAQRKKRKAKLPVYQLVAKEPHYHCAPGDSSCRGCRACRRHAKNKLFASAEAANTHRAHVGCRCGIVEARKLPRRKWRRLFGPPSDPTRVSVDLRDKKVRQKLRGSGH